MNLIRTDRLWLKAIKEQVNSYQDNILMARTNLHLPMLPQLNRKLTTKKRQMIRAMKAC